MGPGKPESMGNQRRALLTDTERDILSQEADVKDNYRYSVESRVRSRLKANLGRDIDVIREFYPVMYDEIVYPTVCGFDDVEPEPEADDRLEHTGGERDDAHNTDEKGESNPESAPSEFVDRSPSLSLEELVDAVLESVDIIGRGAETKEVRREAIRYVWDLLRERGEATTQELANETFDEFKGRRRFDYSESESHYRGYTFWDSCARDVLKELPGVDAPPTRGNTWRFDETSNPRIGSDPE